MSELWRRVNRAIYAVVFVGLLALLLREGSAPWVSVLGHPWSFLGVVLVSGLSQFVQAQSYRQCLPSSSVQIALPELVRIWSLGGLISLVAPLFAGLAVRTALLKSKGVGVRDSSMASARQILLNLEVSMFCAVVVLLAFPSDQFPLIGHIFLMLMLSWFILRRWLASSPECLPRSLAAIASSVLTPPRGKLTLWIVGLPGLMALNYMVAFCGFEVGLKVHEAILLAAITILISAAAIIPNGLGVLDALWIGVARQKGLEMDDSIGMVLSLRLGYLCSMSILWLVLSIRQGDQWGRR